MNWKNLANYSYLGAYSLESEPNNEVVLTIKDVKRELVTAEGGKSEMCILAYFEETKINSVIVKPMVLNKTNCKTIEKLYETGEVEEWIGKRITIYSTTTKFARDVVPCLRIRNEVPEPKRCSICGKEISESLHFGSIEKYGAALCSKECLDKYNENKGE